MVDRVLFAGGEQESFRTSGGVPPINTTSTAGRFDTARSSCAIAFYSASPEYTYVDFKSPNGATIIPDGDVWMHFRMWTGANTNNSGELVVANGATYPLFRITRTAAGVHTAQINTGGGTVAWTTQFTWTSAEQVAYSIDINVKKLGRVVMYVDGSLVGETTLDVTDTIVNFAFGKPPVSGIATTRVISQFLSTEDIPTIGALVGTLHATADGAETGFTGSYTDINEVTLNDATALTALTEDLISTFPMSANSTPVGMDIHSVWLWSRARHGAGEPEGLEAVVRTSNGNFETGLLDGINVGFSPVPAYWERNPDGNAQWTDANIASSQFGPKSALS